MLAGQPSLLTMTRTGWLRSQPCSLILALTHHPSLGLCNPGQVGRLSRTIVIQWGKVTPAVILHTLLNLRDPQAKMQTGMTTQNMCKDFHLQASCGGSVGILGGEDVAQFVQRRTGLPLTQVGFPGPESTSSALSYVCPYTAVCNHMH